VSLSQEAVRAFHRPNSRIADTANEVFLRFSRTNPLARRPEPTILRKTELRRAS
jgi:hypothetical protein